MTKILSENYTHQKHPCPPWACFTLENPLRKLIHNPYSIISPYVKNGDTVLDIGPGKGYFTLPMASMVGCSGRVHAFDVQKEMLDAIEIRAQRNNLKEIIKLHLVKSDDLFFNVKANFALAFWMFHEVPQPLKTIKQIKSMLVANGLFLFVEPLLHVSKKSYLKSVTLILSQGFSIAAIPHVALSRATLFRNRGMLYSIKNSILKFHCKDSL